MTNTEGTEQDHRWELTLNELAATQEKIAKINARAEKRGWTGRLVVDAVRTEVTETNDAGIEATKVFYMTKITGTAPRYNGWEFLAVLDWHSAGGELLTRVSPGVELTGTLDRSNLRPGACDHCDTVRDRKDIYLVRHADGRTLQVGSTCIKDFLGWTAMPVFIRADDIEPEYEGMGGGSRWLDFAVDDVLTVAWALIKRDGFRPASFGNPTKYDVLTVLNPHGEKEKAFAREARALVADAKAQAAQIRAYVLDEMTGNSEYVVNLQVALRASYVTARAFGLVVSAPQAWAKAVERDLTRKAQRDEIANEWMGQEGDKITVSASVKSIRCLDNNFGTTWLYTMVTDDHHMVKWFASKPALGEEVTDKVFVLTGTVKKCDEYQGTKATVLTRCKVQ